MEKFLKAASKHTNGFPQAAGNFMKNLGEIINPSDCWKPFYVYGYQRLSETVCDRASELSESCKAIIISLRQAAACRKLAYIIIKQFHRSSFKTNF
jgi:hypothetical protein